MIWSPLNATLAGFALLHPCGIGGQEPRTLCVGTPEPIAFPLCSANAEYAAERLKMLLGPNAKVGSDKDTNTVWLRADAKAVERAKALLKRLDIPLCRGIFIVRLDNADPVQLARGAGAILAILAFLRDEPAPRLFPLERGRSVTFQSTAAQENRVRWLVRLLDH